MGVVALEDYVEGKYADNIVMITVMPGVEGVQKEMVEKEY